MDVEEGRRLLRAATPGPWNHLGYCGQDGVIQGPRQIPVASAIAGKTSGSTGRQAFDDAALIVWLRNNAEVLLQPPEPQSVAPEMVERVARALRKADLGPLRDLEEFRGEDDWKNWEEDARAAIAALPYPEPPSTERGKGL